MPEDLAFPECSELGGFRPEPAPDTVELRASLADYARSLVGKGRYELRADPADAPKVTDCSGLMWHVFDVHGISLKRYSRRQYDQGYPIPLAEARVGDLVFSPGVKYNHQTHDGHSVGHVGVVVAHNRVVHACEVGIVEESLESFTCASRIVT